jgi:sugar/nucleoside kinase (ribokinase family)
LNLVVVGSVALDTLETPFGRAEDALGGSATHFSLAARHFAPVGIVGVVGTDFPRAHIDLLQERGIDTSGLTVVDGKTFRWSGRYDFDLNVAHTLDTQLNVFADFQPKLPEAYRQARYLFLGNIHPTLQLQVLEQVRPEFTALDTMNFWITGEKAALTEVISKVDAVLINEAEARQYANTPNLLKAAREIRALGPRYVIVKKGEYGSVLFAEDCYFAAPGYPLETVKDPTGAGDSFAGAFMGYIARSGNTDEATLRRAIVYGSVVASFTCEQFGAGRLTTLDDAAIRERYAEFRRITYFEDERE